MFRLFKWIYSKLFGSKINVHAETQKKQKEIQKLAENASIADEKSNVVLSKKNKIENEIATARLTIESARLQKEQMLPTEKRKFGFDDMIDQAEQEIIRLEAELGEIKQEEELVECEKKVALLKSKQVIREHSSFLAKAEEDSKNKMDKDAPKIKRLRQSLDLALGDVDNLESIIQANNDVTSKNSPRGRVSSATIVNCYAESLSRPASIQKQASEGILEIDESIKRKSRIKELKFLEKDLETYHNAVTSGNNNLENRETVHAKVSTLLDGFKKLDEPGYHEVQVMHYLINLKEHLAQKPALENNKQNQQKEVNVLSTLLDKLAQFIKQLEEEAHQLPTMSILSPKKQPARETRKLRKTKGKITPTLAA